MAESILARLILGFVLLASAIQRIDRRRFIRPTCTTGLVSTAHRQPELVNLMSAPPNYFTIKARQGASFQMTGVLTGADGKTPIPNGSLLTLTYTLTDVRTGVVINSRNGTNGLNSNQVTIDVTSTPPTGKLTWTPIAADNPILNSDPNLEDGAKELHLCVFQWTYTDGVSTFTGEQKVFIEVEKYASVQAPNQAGAGPDICTMLITDPSGLPIVGADVWVSSDAKGSTIVAGTLITDQNGRAPFKLTNGSVYYLWMTKTGLSPINGAQFTAVKD